MIAGNKFKRKSHASGHGFFVSGCQSTLSRLSERGLYFLFCCDTLFQFSLCWAPLFCEDAVGLDYPRLECLAEFLISAQCVDVVPFPALDLFNEEDRAIQSILRLICTPPLDRISSLDQSRNALDHLNQFISFESE